MKPEQYLYVGLGLMIAYVIYVNVKGKREPNIDYSKNPEFTNPLPK